MLRGDGALLVVTRRGVRMAGPPVSAPASPDPTSWAHGCAWAWTAAWLTVRGAAWRGPREVLADPAMSGTLQWNTGERLGRAGHRPDLAVAIAEGVVAVEVELQRKATSRLTAILAMYDRRIASGELAGLVYVCGGEAMGERVRGLAADAGIPARALRIELAGQARAEAESATAARRSA